MPWTLLLAGPRLGLCIFLVAPIERDNIFIKVIYTMHVIFLVDEHKNGKVS